MDIHRWPGPAVESGSSLSRHRAGAYNWRRVLPTLGDRAGAVRIVRSATVEVLVAVIVLFVAAVLVALATPLGSRVL